MRAKGVSRWGWCADTENDPCVPGEAAYSDVHLPGLAQGVVGWSGEKGAPFVRFGIPSADANVRRFDAIQFRAAVNPGYQANRPGESQDLSLVLTDGSGNRSVVDASSVDDRALRYPIGSGYGSHFILNEVRFPLSSFSGVHLKDVTSVELRFDRTQSGVLDVSDLAFVSGSRR